MIVGTVVGVVQTNVKRMLAYSSIAHGGYLLVGLVAANSVGKAAILFYLLAYSVTNLAAFGVIAMLGARDRANDSLRDYAGLWNSNPGLAALMTVCLLSLGGLPPTAGFIGKWYIFQAAVSAGYYWLAIVGVLTDDPVEPARDFVAEYGGHWPTVVDPDKAIKSAYRVVARPQTYFVDRTGVVRSIQVGELTDADFERQYARIAQ